MYFSEPLTDFRSQINSDDGRSIGIEFIRTTSLWRLTVEADVSRDTLGQMVRYLHGQFYPGEDEYLADWLSLVDSMVLGKKTTLTLKTVNRL